jgi:unsaturated rhamnogalacturonyl hydrolase
MAARVVKLQQADGLWRSSLLDPASYPMKESSGSALFTYALAWGVNQGLLDRPGYEAGRQEGVDGAGGQRAGRRQADPRAAYRPGAESLRRQATEVYGVGGFLLAGSEVYRMAVLDKAKPQTVTVTNGTDGLRGDELVEVALGSGLKASLKAPVVMDASTSAILNSQVIGKQLLFSVNLPAGDTHRYLVLPAERLAAVPPADVKTHARFVPERLDDFAGRATALSTAFTARPSSTIRRNT